ncbi:Virulence factor BrkB [Quadrisphaera sp. DSM 44207]|nr:Virulence factor BrkB [Quadrisphaera sp. DSM 44207]
MCAAFLAWLYQVGQSADTRWRDALPGALLATAGLVVLLVGFRVYVDVASPQGPDVETGSDAVRVGGRFVGTALAAMLLVPALLRALTRAAAPVDLPHRGAAARVTGA